MNKLYLSVSIKIIHLAELQTICKEYWNKISQLESDKYDLEKVEQFKSWEVKSNTRTNLYFYIFMFLVFLYLDILNLSKSNLISLKN
jgi:hypothetical protein